MTSLTLHLPDELVERVANAAKDQGVSLETMILQLVQGSLDDDAYGLDEEEDLAIEEGIADMKARRWITHEQMMQELRAQRER